MIESPFLLVLSHEGQDELVKNEFGIRFLGAKFSFSRPGFLSFKQSEAMTGQAANWKWEATNTLVYPLRTALFAGKWIAGKGLTFTPGWEVGAPLVVSHLHAIDVHTRKAPQEEGITRTLTPSELGEKFPDFLAALEPGLAERGAKLGALPWNEEAQVGDVILQAFVVSETEVWLGLTELRDTEFGWPGGESHIEKAEGSPSRASVKIEEAIALLERRIGAPFFKPNEIAIEVGSAPGGAVFSLLERGLRVTGVDRSVMAPEVDRHPKFTRVESSIGDWMFPEEVTADWLLLDMNAEPKIALREIKPLLDYIRRGLKGIFFTLKLNQTDFALVAERLAKTTAKDIGLTTYFFKRLPSNHQEVAFFGLTSRATAKVFVKSQSK